MFTPEGGLNEELVLALQIERELETEDLMVLGRLRKTMREMRAQEKAALAATARQPERTAPAVRLATDR